MNDLSQAEYFKKFEDECQEELQLTVRKNTDYSGETKAFRNFDFIEISSEGRITAEQGILVRMTDKMQRITNLLDRARGPAVADEKIIDTLRDLSVYAKILRIYMATKGQVK
jgi:hypothetical protein